MEEICCSVSKRLKSAAAAALIAFLAACGGGGSGPDAVGSSKSDSVATGSVISSPDGLPGGRKHSAALLPGVPTTHADHILAVSDGKTLAVAADRSVLSWGEGLVLPSQLNGLTNVSSIAEGPSHGAARTADGLVWTWGYDWGQGTPITSLPQQVLGIAAVQSVAVGETFTLAATSDGSVWGWGLNVDDVLGPIGLVGQTSAPVRIEGISGVVAVTAGFNYGLALKSDGTVWAWGANSQGLLGEGAPPNYSTAQPVQVVGLADIVAISGGDLHAVAIKSDGTVWTWGSNTFGQLGYGTASIGNPTPRQVEGLSRVAAVAAYATYSLALQTDGTVWTWGSNSLGQLGNGSTTPSTVPTRVDGLSNVTRIAYGWSNSTHSVVMRGDGTVWAWGANAGGQIGDGTTTQALRPVQVKGVGGDGYLTLGIRNVGTQRILFLHGVLGSSLSTCVGDRAKTMWVTGRDADFGLLALGPSGEPSGVTFVGRVVESTVVNAPLLELNRTEVYGKFAEFMNRAFPGEWVAFPYDWRLGPDAVIDRPTVFGTPTDEECAALNSGRKTLADFPQTSLLDEVRRLAAESPTGKITVVAHSNGGLVAKRLVQKLGPVDASALIDRVILVATPQLGTPHAIKVVLHGMDFIPDFGFIIPHELARETSRSMGSSHLLLPSFEFFKQTPGLTYPMVQFGDVSADRDYEAMRSYFGGSIQTEDKYLSYLFGGDGRPSPAFSESMPDVVLPSRWNEAMALHGAIDSLVDSSASPMFLQIAGTGLATTSAIKYQLVERCTTDFLSGQRNCQYLKYPFAEKSIEGDKTVLLRSAIAMRGAPAYVVDLGDVCRQAHSERSHASLLAYEPVQQLLQVMLKGVDPLVVAADPNSELSKMLGCIRLPTSAPFAGASDYLSAKIYSPARLRITDAKGRITQSVSLGSDTTILGVQREIPGSALDSPRDATVPTGGGPYSFEIIGEGDGVFTFELSRVVSGMAVERLIYPSVPVTPTTVARVEYAGPGAQPSLVVDADGTGQHLTSVTAQRSFRPVALASPNQTVRFGSRVTLDGSASFDTDQWPAALKFAWASSGTPTAEISGADSPKSTFVPRTAGRYRVKLVVSDGLLSSNPAEVEIVVPILGDINIDGAVDVKDLKIMLAALGQPASGPNDLRDLNGDGSINPHDVRKLITSCTRPLCAPIGRHDSLPSWWQ